MKNTSPASLFFHVSILQAAACLLIGAFLFSQAEAAAPSGAFVWYKADSNLTDSKGNTTAALLPAASMSYASGRVSDAFDFDGAHALRISENTAGGLNFGTDNFTIAAWVRYSDASQAPVIYQNGYAFNSVVLLYVLTSGKPRFFIRDASANAITIDGTTVTNDNAWHYIVAVKSGRSALLYIDGDLQACQTNFSLGNINTNCGFGWIGGTNTTAGCATAPSERFFTGLIDEFFIAKTDLPGSEILNLHNNP